MICGGRILDLLQEVTVDQCHCRQALRMFNIYKHNRIEY